MPAGAEANPTAQARPPQLAAAAPTSVAPSAAGEDAASGAIRRWVEESTVGKLGADAAQNPDAAGGMPIEGLRVEVQLGRLNPRLQLPECARMEPFLPPHARLWGRGYVGVRCVEGASWSTMLPVTVSVFGPALVATHALGFGAVADPSAFRIDEVDWARSRSIPLSDPAVLNGQVLARPLAAGQPLLQTDLKTANAFTAGDPVRIRVLGSGFTISATGFAMAAAGEGQSLRVRTDSGKLLVGVVRNRTVEVKL